MHIHGSAECRKLNATQLARKSIAVPFSPEGKLDQQLWRSLSFLSPTIKIKIKENLVEAATHDEAKLACHIQVQAQQSLQLKHTLNNAWSSFQFIQGNDSPTPVHHDGILGLDTLLLFLYIQGDFENILENKLKIELARLLGLFWSYLFIVENN